MRYSCRAVVGYGQACEPNYQCEACAAKQKYIPRIEKLEAALRDLSDGWECCPVSQAMRRVAREALEGKDD
jgi:hypothetical protein